MGLTVYCDPCTVNSRKVLAGLDLLGTKYDFKKVDYFKAEQKSDWYSEINPHQTVPSAVDGDYTITESNAIMQYAADHGGKHEYYPQDLKERSLVNKWLLWEASVWFQTNYVYLVEYVVKPLLGAEPDESIIKTEADKWNRNAAILDAQLGKTKWIVGDGVTIADIAIAAPMHLHAAQKLPLDSYKNLSRWLSQIEELPSWQKTQGAVDSALIPGKSAAATTNGDSKQGSSVKSTFNYTKDVDKLTELYFYEDPKAADIHEPGDDAHEMNVHDGWYRAKDFDMDKEGFSLHDFTSKYDDGSWENDERVRKEFYPEVVEFMKKTTGAKEVLVFDHTIRTKANLQKKLTQETNTSQRAPVMLVHCDYTAESGPVRVKQLLPDTADKLLQHRVAFLNVWKPIHNVVEERPLAMCDVSTAPQDDFFKLYLHYRDRTGENYVMRHNR